MGGFSLLHPPDANFEDEKIVLHYFFKYPYEERNHKLMTSCWLVRSIHATKILYIFRRFTRSALFQISQCLPKLLKE